MTRPYSVATLAERWDCSRTPHTLRHTAASWQEEAGVPMQVISRFMGHATEAVTRGIYAKPKAVVTKGAADVIELRMRKK